MLKHPGKNMCSFRTFRRCRVLSSRLQETGFPCHQGAIRLSETIFASASGCCRVAASDHNEYYMKDMIQRADRSTKLPNSHP